MNTLNTHLQHYWYLKKPLYLQTGPGIARQSANFKTECYKAANLIYKKYERNKITVCLSGGIDSECVLLSFLEQNIPVRVAVMRFNNKLNEHDIKYALKLVEELGLEYVIYDLDVESFLDDKQHLKYALEHDCVSPQIATHLWLINQLPEPFVFSGAPIRAKLNRENTNFEFIDVPSENQICMENYIRGQQKQGLGNFFLYTPELIYSSILSSLKICSTAKPDTQNFIENQYDQFSEYEKGLFLDWINKWKVMLHSGFLIHPRPNKLTGFEQLQKKYGPSLMAGMTEFNKRFRQPMLEASNKLVPSRYFVFGKENSSQLAQDFPIDLKESSNIGYEV